MLRKRNLLICFVAVAFCLVGIESAKACDDWYFDDFDMWMFFLWDCSEYSWPSDEIPSTYAFLDSHVGWEKRAYVFPISYDNIYSASTDTNSGDSGNTQTIEAYTYSSTGPYNRRDSILVQENQEN